MSRQNSIDKLLQTAAARMGQEVGNLIGQEFSFTKPTGRVLAKKDLLSLLDERVVLTRMQVTGDVQGEAYISVDLADAILLGGSLILLPQDEIKNRQKSKIFDGEVDDAFGEVANILAGVYAAVFDEKHTPKLHFKKTSLEAVDPSGLEPEDQAPFPPGTYYLSSSELTMGGITLGTLHAFFPADLLGLEPTESPPQVQPQPQAAMAKGEAPRDLGGPSPRPATFQPGGKSLILVVSENQAEAQSFATPLAGKEDILCLNVQTNIREAVKSLDIRGVFLVMREVGDRGFALVIKIQSAVKPSTPVIVAGPQWTRQTVLQAVKYGACDILMTPTTPDELQEKITRHMSRKG